MQNHTYSGTSRFSTPQPNMDVSCQRNHNKSPQMYQIWGKCCNIFRFHVCVQCFKFFLPLYVLSSEIEVIKCRKQNMAVLLNVSL